MRVILIGAWWSLIPTAGMTMNVVCVQSTPTIGALNQTDLARVFAIGAPFGSSRGHTTWFLR